VQALGRFFLCPPDGVRAAVLTTSGDHFSAGVDLNELQENNAFEGVEHSQSWRAPFNAIERGSIPVVAALRGAVIGGGLELALTTHIRVADTTAYYALPEGSRGIFVGGGGSVRLPRVIGVAAMMDLMLTGRVLDAAEGHARGVSQYLVDEGQAEAKAIELADRIGQNAPVSNFAVLQALPRIAEMGPDEGLFVESLMAGITGSTDEAHEMLQAFLSGRANKVNRTS
jgi:enoyl-CoA hydratase/carnithine racemase